MKEPFEYLCELAYEGMMTHTMVFSGLPSDVNTLGLLQGVEVFQKHGKTLCYYFLHSSIQEILAACYIANSGTKQQSSMFVELFNRHNFDGVLQYYAAITKLNITEIRDMLLQFAKTFGVKNADDQAKHDLLSLLHCIHEANESPICESIAQPLQHELNFDGVRLTPLDCLCISFFLARIKSDCLISTASCSIGDEGCKYFVDELCTCVDSKPRRAATFGAFLMDNVIGDEGVRHLSKLIEVGCVNMIDLSFNAGITDLGVSYISHQLVSNTSLTTLNLSACGIGSEGAEKLSEALQTNNTLQKLNISLNSIKDNGIQHLARMLSHNCGLRALHLVSCGMTDVGVGELADSLRGNNFLKKLYVWNDPIDGYNHLTDKGISNVIRCLEQDNSSLLDLWLPEDFSSNTQSMEETINEMRRKKEVPLIKVVGKSQLAT